jgi:hypothetical protein
MSPETFAELLARQMRVAGVVVGENYRFGYRAAGNAALLQRLGPRLGMRVRVLSLVEEQAGSAGGSSEAVVAGDGAAHASDDARQQPQQQQQQPPGSERPPGPQPGQPSSEGQQHQQLPAVQPGLSEPAVSSSRVRQALARGDLADAAACLGRPYRLVASLANAAGSVTPASSSVGATLRLPATALLNQPPCPGCYPVVASLTGAETLQQLGQAVKAEVEIDEAGVSLRDNGTLLAEIAYGC